MLQALAAAKESSRCSNNRTEVYTAQEGLPVP